MEFWFSKFSVISYNIILVAFLMKILSFVFFKKHSSLKKKKKQHIFGYGNIDFKQRHQVFYFFFFKLSF